MSLFGLLEHLFNFVAPALLVGFMVAAIAPLIMRKKRSDHSWLTQGAINSGASLLVLLVGLAFFGRDGKMATYAAMVLVCASGQWFASKAWRT